MNSSLIDLDNVSMFVSYARRGEMPAFRTCCIPWIYSFLLLSFRVQRKFVNQSIVSEDESSDVESSN